MLVAAESVDHGVGRVCAGVGACVCVSVRVRACVRVRVRVREMQSA